MPQVCFRCSDETVRRLLEIGKEMGMPMSGSVRLLIEKGLKEYKRLKVYDELNDSQKDVVNSLIYKLNE